MSTGCLSCFCPALFLCLDRPGICRLIPVVGWTAPSLRKPPLMPHPGPWRPTGSHVAHILSLPSHWLLQKPAGRSGMAPQETAMTPHDPHEFSASHLLGIFLSFPSVDGICTVKTPPCHLRAKCSFLPGQTTCLSLVLLWPPLP